MATHRITEELAEVTIRFKRNGEWWEFVAWSNNIEMDYEPVYEDIMMDDMCYNRWPVDEKLTITSNITKIDGRFGVMRKVND